MNIFTTRILDAQNIQIICPFRLKGELVVRKAPWVSFYVQGFSG